MKVTSDGEYEYRIELINRFQRNNRTRVHIINLAIGEETTMPLDISTDDFGSLWGEESGSISPEQLKASAMSTLVSIETENIYILSTTKRSKRNGVFEIDMTAQTAKKLFMENNYRSDSMRMRDDDGEAKYTYLILMVDRYQENDRVTIEATLEIIDHENRKSHCFSLPIDAELLEKDSLRHTDSIWAPFWITMEETDTMEQFIVQTTKQLS